MTSLSSWSTDDVITWVKANLPKEYHGCIVQIEAHDIDGKLLKECLTDPDAKASLLQILFPHSKNDAFLRLSFMRKIEKFNDNYDNDNKSQNTTKSSDDIPSNMCVYCGVAISPLLIENHQRHCFKQSQSQTAQSCSLQGDKEAEHETHDSIEEHTTICCAFCEIEFELSLIDEHETYCGSRTELCPHCGSRDTLMKFKRNQHNCGNINIRFHNTPLDINDDSNSSLISSFERHLYDLQKILHDRFVVDYNQTSSHFEQYDSFGNNKKKLYQQKTNQNISKIRTYHLSKHDVSNEARHKFEKMDLYGGKSKDELRKIYDEKFKIIIHLLRKILENITDEPLNKRYRVLKCDNKKLKTLIFSYSPCCEFLKLCGFVYVLSDGCYKLTDANNAKLKIGVGVLKYVWSTFETQATKQDYEQNRWELNQAYIRNDKSLFHGSWSCKKCNHLNRKTSICKKCKAKKKHSLRKQQRERAEIPLSVERWICGNCGNRNAVELTQCDNCKHDKLIATQPLNQSPPKPNHSEDDLYLHHDEWM